MRINSTLLIIVLIAMISVAAPLSAQKAGAAPEKREHTVYIVDKGFSNNEKGFGTLVLVLDALPGHTNAIRVINKSTSPHGFRMQIGNQEFGLDGPVAPGKTAQFDFTAPAGLRGSDGNFFSPTGDDRKNGFEGRVTLLLEAEGG
jgi:hypothetical protein